GSGEFSLLFRMHHSLLDGRSLTTLLRALLDGAPQVDVPASLAEPRTRRRTAVGGPGMLAAGLAVPLPGKGERAPAYTVVHLPAGALRAARAAGAGAVAGTGAAAVGAEEGPATAGPGAGPAAEGSAASAPAASAAAGRVATTNEVFLAAVSGVLRSCLLTAEGDWGDSGGARRVWLSVPVDQRPSEHGDFLGNAFTNVRVPAPVDLADPAARLAACTGLLTTETRPRRTAEKVTESAFAAFPAVTQALARGRFFAADYAPAACSYVHLRESGRTLAGRALRRVTVVPMVPPDDTVTFGLGGCSRGHTLSVATNSGTEDADLLAEAFLHELGLLGRRTEPRRTVRP
ncbi:hypothetical protein ACWD25_47205, partial [Streptomyces sp. NPDC002920]